MKGKCRCNRFAVENIYRANPQGNTYSKYAPHCADSFVDFPAENSQASKIKKHFAHLPWCSRGKASMFSIGLHKPV